MLNSPRQGFRRKDKEVRGERVSMADSSKGETRGRGDPFVRIDKEEDETQLMISLQDGLSIP